MFSILIPYYNHRDYILCAINSLISSSYLIDKIIIVDDGSTDDGMKLLSQYKSPISSKIIVEHQINQGVHVAINNAFQISKSKYIAILNSDDIFLPSKLEKSLRLLNNYSVDLLWGKISFINNSGFPLNNLSRSNWYYEALKQFPTYISPVAALMHENIVGTSSNIVVTSDLFKRVGGFRGYRYASDLDFVLQCLCRDEVRHSFESEVLVGYRYHDKNTISEDILATTDEVEHIAFNLIPNYLERHPKLRSEFMRASKFRGLSNFLGSLSE